METTAADAVSDLSKLNLLNELGFNRISLGIQTVKESLLKKMGRGEQKEGIYNRAYANAVQANFEVINLDLMYGLPAQSVADAMTDLERAISLAPEHISWYQLTIEPNTPFHHTPPILPNDDYLWEMQMAGQNLLSEYICG